MPFLDGFNQDLFISYAHIDNRPDRDGERGWVESFQRALELRLLKRFGREVDIWRDPELGRSQQFDPVIERAVKGSGVMLSLITESYLNSDYCRQELEWFTAGAAGDRIGLTVDHHVRVFPILLYNIDPAQWPEGCRATSGFCFHDAEAREFGKPLSPLHDVFTDRVCDLVDELHTVLGAMSHSLRSPEAPIAPKVSVSVPATTAPGTAAAETVPISRTVFLAEVSDEMRRDRRLLRQRLENENIQVVQGIPPPDDSAAHEAAMIDALGRSALAIHLLGANPGRPLDDDEPAITYPTEQLRIGLENANSQIVALPPGLEAEDIVEPGYGAFIQALQEREREADRLEVLRAGPQQLAEEVIAKLDRLEQQQGPGGGGQDRQKSAFVDLHVNDLAFAGDLVRYLSNQDMPAVTIPSGDLDPNVGLSLFEDHLANAEVFIVVFGKVQRSWVEQRLNEAFKLILSKQLSTRIGVYLAPPGKSEEQSAFPPFFEVMNNSERFDATTLDALLGSLRANE
jgi:hypothetical protein